ncbi:MAG: NFACT family protein [Candidatus Aenigmarchaeota archaeon]|nr:NFACT family protein [Candidatus Aenigmarchaeota archaeon]
MSEKTLAGFEIAHSLREIRSLEGSHIEKIYHAGRELVISSKAGNLYAFPGGCFLLSKKEGFETPTNFAMLLRKHLKGKIIERIYQHGSDRVAVLQAQNAFLVMEMFHKGNFILTDREWKIIMPMEFQRWKDRAIVPKEIYRFPESRDIRNPEVLRGEAANGAERTLVMNGIGKYAKEALAESGVTAGVPDEVALSRLSKTVISFFERRTDARLVQGSGGYEDAIPFPMKMYEGRMKEAPSFSAALEKIISRQRAKEGSASEKRMEAEKRILDQQKKKAEEFSAKEKEQKRKAEILERNYADAEVLLSDAGALRKAGKLAEAQALLGPRIAAVSAKKPSLTVRFESEDIELSLSKPLQKNVADYHEKAKFYRKKTENIAKEMGKVLDRMNILEIKQKRREAKVHGNKWYGKYRHFFTSDGFLVVSGKDAATNESLVKKHLEQKDTVLHAEIHGAAFTVIKAGDAPAPSEQSIKEAAQFAACYSKAWAMGLGSVDVYWVTPEQVDKTPNTGEHLSKGSFMIHGKKNYLKGTRLALACGIIDGAVAVVPLETAVRKTPKHVVIMPGDTEARRLAKRVMDKLKEICSKPEQTLIEGARIDAMIPAGRGALG